LNPILPEHQPDFRPVKDAGPLFGRPRWRLFTEWESIWRGILILGRKGYESDLASVPRIAYRFGYTPDGLHRAASLPHDIGCQRQGVLVKGSAIGRPEHAAVLLGDNDFIIKPADMAGQLPAADVHEMFHEYLKATEGMRPLKVWVEAQCVKRFGPRWKLLKPGQNRNRS
jgi:hypothetical protein